MRPDRRTLAAALLAGGIALAAALGVPGDGMLQDSFKSAVIAASTLLAALAIAWPAGREAVVFRWHAVLLLPLLLGVYALVSMAWAPAWPAGVEAARWLSISLVAAVAMNAFAQPATRLLAARCIGAGVVFASLWVVLQFIAGFELFPQGARPGGTFVNRNFFAEFAVCTLPFLAWLMGREPRRIHQLAASVAGGVVVTAVLMTGARAALVAMAILLIPALLSSRRSPGSSVSYVIALATVLALGLIPTGDARIASEARGDTALSRAFTRTAAIAAADESTRMRVDMWRATAQTIASHPLTGIGAGAWESDADFHAHNEFLQLVAEYGVAGWLFLLALAVSLARIALARPDPWHATLLCSLLAVFVVSAAGFPWHLAATGAMFGSCLGALAVDASHEVRLARRSRIALAAACAVLLAATLCAAATVGWAESRLSRAVRIAHAIGESSAPNDARWLQARSEMLRLVDEGMRLHPNERLLTPLVADELGRWGDWPNAVRIWEHVLRAHPNAVILLTNVARGYTALGRRDLAVVYLERARAIQPGAASVRAVDALLRQTSSSKG